MTYVLSDIHGNLQRFNSVLEQIKLKPEDSLYILGDVVDRYPHGIEILQTIMAMPNAHMLLGNHEYMMMDALGFPYEEHGCTEKMTEKEKMAQWFRNGGEVTYRAWMRLSDKEKEDIRQYLKSLPLEINLTTNEKRFKLVHATWIGIYDILADEADEEELGESKAYFSVWDRDTVSVLANVKEFTTVFGHTPTYEFSDKVPLEVFRHGSIIGVDCGAGFPDYGKKSVGRLACIRLEDMQTFYSNG